MHMCAKKQVQDYCAIHNKQPNAILSKMDTFQDIYTVE